MGSGQYYHNKTGSPLEAYFEQGDFAFDVGKNDLGTTIWHLIRQGKRSD
ncbi:hypothetical protein QVM88_11265 [Providencia stuartii]|nr:hypothetical protein [Providencia stuartii]MDN0006928.1 hypothetical protein [Providencia stuartii]